MDKPTTKRCHGCCGQGRHICKEGRKIWNTIDLTSNHLNGRTRCKKVGPQGVLAKQEDETLITWVKHAKGHIIYQPSTIKNESCRNRPNHTTRF
jgi:hypothetical protein